MIHKLTALAFTVVVAAAALAGYRLAQSHLAAQVYRERLVELGSQYEDLRSHYNTAVSKTAVTELRVEDGDLSVAIRTADGRVQRIPTPYRAGAQIYVDYVVIDGRLWIRRVFDDRTAPESGVIIDPALAHIDWDAPTMGIGKAVSRRLTEGRWVVTVTGDGSLGLAQADTPTDLTATPPLADYHPLNEHATTEVQPIGPTDVLRRLIFPPAPRETVREVPPNASPTRSANRSVAPGS